MTALRTLGCMAYAVLVCWLCWLAFTGDYTPDHSPPTPAVSVPVSAGLDNITMLEGTICTPTTAKNGCRP